MTAAGAEAATAGWRWLDEHRLEAGGLVFSAGIGAGSSDDVVIVKPAALVQRYVDLLTEEEPQVIVELGTKDGGSAALMAAVGRPEVLLTVDLAPEVPPVLQRLVAESRDGCALVARTGLDQGDAEALAAAVEVACGDRPIDLVVDDASHVLGPTRTSFDVLFPRVRTGGTYVVEDWSSEAIVAARLARSVPVGAPDFEERLALVRSLVLRLNDPSASIPDDVVAALTSARREVVADPTGASEVAFFDLLVDAAARVDVGTLRAVLLPDLPRPLVDLAVELSMVAATRPDVVAAVELTEGWIKVRRGPAPLPVGGFRLSDQWADHFAYLRTAR